MGREALPFARPIAREAGTRKGKLERTGKKIRCPGLYTQPNLAVGRYRPGGIVWSGGMKEMAVARPLLVESSVDT